MSGEQPKVEKEHQNQSSEGEQEHDHEHGHEAKPGSKGEKKFKKAMGKMGLKPCSGINRVTIKKGKNFVISIDDPDVWKSPGNESAYIIFGKPNLDGLQTGQSEMDQYTNPINPDVAQQPKVEEAAETKNEPATKTEEPATEDLSEEGLSPDNIKMVMQYSKCTKAEAIRALRETNDDPVNAIMKLAK